MAQMTDSLARAIIDGAGFTRNEVEQLARRWLQSAEDTARLDWLISTGNHVWGSGANYVAGEVFRSENITIEYFDSGRAAIDAAMKD